MKYSYFVCVGKRTGFLVKDIAWRSLQEKSIGKRKIKSKTRWSAFTKILLVFSSFYMRIKIKTVSSLKYARFKQYHRGNNIPRAFLASPTSLEIAEGFPLQSYLSNKTASKFFSLLIMERYLLQEACRNPRNLLHFPPIKSCQLPGCNSPDFLWCAGSKI